MTANQAGALVSLGIALFLLAIVALLVLEAWLLWTGHEPITWYTRRVENVFPGPAMFAAGLVMLTVGALFAHFVWDAKAENPKPPAQ